MDDFPHSELSNNVQESIELLRSKLAKKEYETGILYLKMEEYESAKITFQIVIDKYYDTIYSILSKKEIIKALAKNREIDNAYSLLLVYEPVLKKHTLFEAAKQDIDLMKFKISKENK